MFSTDNFRNSKVMNFFRTMYLLGYIPADNRLYLGDKELNVVSFSLLLSVLEYQTAVMRKDFDTADKVNNWNQ
jgi:coatomer subunit beta'